MLLPTKHTNFSKSILGFGSYVLTKLDTPKSLDSLWYDYQKNYEKGNYPAKHSFDNMVLAVIFLYSLGLVEEKDGVVYKCN